MTKNEMKLTAESYAITFEIVNGKKPVIEIDYADGSIVVNMAKFNPAQILAMTKENLRVAISAKCGLVTA